MDFRYKKMILKSNEHMTLPKLIFFLLCDIQTRATKSVDSHIYAMKPGYFRLYFHNLIMQLHS